MRKLLWLVPALCLVILVGCRGKTAPETTTRGNYETQSATLGEEDIAILASTLGEEESTAPYEKGSLLEILQQGSLSGHFIEDGSDEPVENVACALIRNNGDWYLDYGLVTAEAGNEIYHFVVTGLPGGDGVWVMERDRKTVEAGTVFTFAEEQVSQLRKVCAEDERVNIDLLDGKVSVTNTGEKALASVRIYYKQVHSDGNYLGGITYTCVAEAVEPGATVEVPGGHSRARGCAVVRVDITE